MRKTILFILLTALTVGCAQRAFTPAERALILESDSLMYVTTIDVPADSAILRAISVDLTPRELASPELEVLLAKMLYTVQHPTQDGVGIAAPQVGLNKRIVCVQRFDKAGEPFECYLNAHIDSLGGEIAVGPEGCLSIPGKRGLVPRHTKVQIRYVAPGTTDERTEEVEGFTAVIFQHEIDHLEGILYTDRADTVFVDNR